MQQGRHAPRGESRQQLVSSIHQKKAEVEALVRCHGIDVDMACEIVCIEVSVYMQGPAPDQSRIDWLPLPSGDDGIWEEARRLREARPEEDREPPAAGFLLPADPES